MQEIARVSDILKTQIKKYSMANEIGTIDSYIKTFPKEVQLILYALKKTIEEEIPNVEEGIRYNMPTFFLNGDYIIYFAAWKKHISLYPFTDEMVKKFPETARYNTSGKGTIQFPINEPLPFPLIRKIVAIRLKEYLAERKK